jgi:hypothetical protein
MTEEQLSRSVVEVVVQSSDDESAGLCEVYGDDGVASHS